VKDALWTLGQRHTATRRMIARETVSWEQDKMASWKGLDLVWKFMPYLSNPLFHPVLHSTVYEAMMLHKLQVWEIKIDKASSFPLEN
jgi:hypothetical protein